MQSEPIPNPNRPVAGQVAILDPNQLATKAPLAGGETAVSFSSSIGAR